MSQLRIRFPPLHEHQQIFGHWHHWHPKAQCLIAPCGTKLGKSFGCGSWLGSQALITPGSYCAWIGPTKLKAKIGYRYIKAMLPDHPSIHCVDSELEIHLRGNRSFIKFLHGRDAETTVEGEAIDRFVIDESGKQSKQLWYSLFTTITQTRGLGIVTGTPRGHTWYYDEYRKAMLGDPFYCHTHLPTRMSPYVSDAAIENARRLLPAPLFKQYYEALFISSGSVFGDLSELFTSKFNVKPTAKFWIHPDADARSLDTVTGYDIAKHRDYSVFYTVNTNGDLVGFARFRKVPYEVQVERLRYYLHTYFTGDRDLRYDATGVGDVVGELITDKDIDANIDAVKFTNKSKQEMVSMLTHAIETGWHKNIPKIEQIEHEYGSYEVKVTKSGLFSYAAPDGGHDDVVSSAMLAVSGAYGEHKAEMSDKILEEILTGEYPSDDDSDILADISNEFTADGYFDDDTLEEDIPDDFSFDD